MKVSVLSYASEFIGTLLLTFTIFATGHALPIGIALIIGILFCGQISGAHFNPAVTVVQYMNKSFPLKEVFPYVMSQITGAVVGLELYKLTKGNITF